MSIPVHLIVETGPDPEIEIRVTADGVRVGRSSNNDVIVRDPAMSRFHGRFFFKPGDGLWAEDLGGANQSELNGKPFHESRLKIGDRVTMGDTTFKVVNADAPSILVDATPPAPGPSINVVHPAASGRIAVDPLAATGKLFDAVPAGMTGRIDILRKTTPDGVTRTKPKPALLILLGIMTVVVAGIFGFKIVAPRLAGSGRPAGQSAVTPNVNDPAADALLIAYEKIDGSPSNIFRYAVSLAGNELAIQVDDLQSDRHVPLRKKLDAEAIRDLLDSLRATEFFELKNDYKGLSSSVWAQWDLAITVGRKAHRVVVLNAIEPEGFKAVRSVIETFVQSELSVSPLSLPPEKLQELARTTWLRARALHDQREIKFENLALAIRALKEVDWYLETVEPKPDYYPDAVALGGDCERELNSICENHTFLADRAIKLQDWTEAAAQLRTLIERLPDKADERHKEARKKLIDVERRLKKK